MSYRISKKTKSRKRKSIKSIYKSLHNINLKKNSKELRKSLKKIIRNYSPIDIDELKTNTKHIINNMRLYEEKYKESISHSLNVLNNDLLEKTKHMNNTLVEEYKILLENILILHEHLTNTNEECITCIYNNNYVTIHQRLEDLLLRYIKYFSSSDFKNTYKRYIKLFYTNTKDNRKIKEAFSHELQRPIERINKYRQFLDELYLIYNNTEEKKLTELICKSQQSLELVESCVKRNENCDIKIRDEDVVCKKKKRESIFV